MIKNAELMQSNYNYKELALVLKIGSHSRDKENEFQMTKSEGKHRANKT